MAEGIVNNSWIVENFTPTIYTANNFELKSWGSLRCIRIGEIVIVSVHGLTNTVGTTGDKAVLRIPYRPRISVSAVGTTIESGLVVQCAEGSYDIVMSAVEANKSIYFQIVIPIV